MSTIVYSRIVRPKKINEPLHPVVMGITGETSFGVPHYDIITIDGVSYEAYSCGCPKMEGLAHDPYPQLNPEGAPMCETYKQYRNETYYPDINKEQTTTLQCGCKYNFWCDDTGLTYWGHCHSPEKCIQETPD